MERRLYFILGDLSAAVLSGACAGWLVQFMVPVSFNGPLAMAAAMLIGIITGMAVGMLCGLLSSPFFGAMEPVLPASLAGMMAGMVIGTAMVMSTLSPLNAALGGAAIGALCLLYTYVQQTRLFGDVDTPVKS